MEPEEEAFMPDSEAYQPAEGVLVMPEPDIPPHDEDATALQDEVNLHIGWMMICGQPVASELHDVNIKLVDVARTTRPRAAQRQIRGVPSSQRGRADRKAAVDGA